MKLIIPKIPGTISGSDIAEVNSFLLQQDANPIDRLNWEKEFPYRPEVSFRIASNDSTLFIRYDVTEKYILAKATANNGEVWCDSCLEFFLSPEGNDEYYNLEINCIGTKLLGFRRPGAQAEHAADEILAGITAVSSLGNTPLDEKKGNFTWNMLVAVPFSSFWKHTTRKIGPACKANFYKCGDNLTEPHYLSWNPIDFKRPNFHLPQFFGEIEL